MGNFKYEVRVYLKDDDKVYLSCDQISYNQIENVYVFVDGKDAYNIYFERYHIARENVASMVVIKTNLNKERRNRDEIERFD